MKETEQDKARETNPNDNGQSNLKPRPNVTMYNAGGVRIANVGQRISDKRAHKSVYLF
jgi:hypothetical protein